MTNKISNVVNQKTTVIIIVVILLVGVGIMFALKPTDTSVQNATSTVIKAQLVTSTEQYDFGTIDINGGKVTTEFPVTNMGEETVTILDGTTSCACTSAELDGVSFDMHKGMNRTVTIEPGETKIMTATYDPLFHGPNSTGRITREVILKTNSVVTPEIRARFKADVIKL